MFYRIAGSVFLGVFFVTLSLFSIDLDYNSALEIAYQNNADILQLEKDFRIAKFELDYGFANMFYPSIKASGSYTYQGSSDNGSIRTVKQEDGIVELTNYTYSDSYSLSVSLNKTLFDGFQNYNTFRTKKVNYTLSERKLYDKKKEIKLNLLSSFFKVLLLQSNIETLKLSMELSSNQILEALQKFNLRQATQIDVNKAKLSYQQSYLKLLEAQHNYEKEKLNLSSLLGLTNGEDINIKNKFYDIESCIKLGEGDLNPEKIINSSLSNDITYFTYECNIENERLNGKTLEWSRFPSISAGINYAYSYERDRNTLDLKSWQGSWSIGLNASLPLDALLPNSSIDSQISVSKENLKKYLLQKEAYEKSLQNTVRSYFLDFKYNKELLENQKMNLQIAGENFNLAKKQKELGRIKEIDFITSEIAYLQAKNDYESAYYDYYMVLAKIERMIE